MSDHHPQMLASEFSPEEWHTALGKRPKQDPKGSKVHHHSRLPGPVEWSFPIALLIDSESGKIRFSGIAPEYLGFDPDFDGELCACFRLQPGTVVVIEAFARARGGNKHYVHREVMDILEMEIESLDSVLENLLQGPAPDLMQSMSRLVQLPRNKQREAGEQRPNQSPEGMDPHGS